MAKSKAEQRQQDTDAEQQRRSAAREHAVQHAAHELDGPRRTKLRHGVE